MAHINITVERHWNCDGTMTRSRLFSAREPLTTREGAPPQLTAGELIRRGLEIESGKMTPVQLREQIRRLEVTAMADFSSKKELTDIVSRLTSPESFVLQTARFLNESRADDHPKNGLDVSIHEFTPTDLTRMESWHVYSSGQSFCGGNPSAEEITRAILQQLKSILISWDKRIDRTEERIFAVRLSLSHHAGNF